MDLQKLADSIQEKQVSIRKERHELNKMDDRLLKLKMKIYQRMQKKRK